MNNGKTDLSKLGIVILNYNSCAFVLKCVESIVRFYERSIRIVIVDNRSSDESVNLLNKNFSVWPNIDILISDINGGYSYGNNFGIKHILANYGNIEYMALINPDVEIIDNTIFQNLISRLHEDDSLAGISPLMIVDGAIKPNRWAFKVPRHINLFLSSFIILRSVNPLIYKSFKINPDNLVAYVDAIPGSFFIMKRDIFVKVKLLDEKVFLFGEEIILGKKVMSENYKLGISFRDYYLHNQINIDYSLWKKFIHLKYSHKSHLYFNIKYNNLFWGSLDAMLLIIFLPFKLLEIISIHLYVRLKRMHQ
jgi:GT2 family glycosyltransferase